MPKISNRARKIPKFIRKLIQIIEDSRSQNIITWLTDDAGFHILDPSKFIQQVLPAHFKHKNMSSFVRQLNMYGFNRPKESDHNIYTNKKFVKGNLNSIRQIQRRVLKDAGAAQEQNGLETSSISIDQSLNNKSSQMCQKILQQNQKLKKQNLELTKKLSYLTAQYTMLQSMPLKLFNFNSSVPSQGFFFNSLNCNMSPYYASVNTDATSKSESESSLIPSMVGYEEHNGQKMHSFTLGEHHKDMDSLASYHRLLGQKINEEKQESKNKNKQKEKEVN